MCVNIGEKYEENIRKNMRKNVIKICGEIRDMRNGKSFKSCDSVMQYDKLFAEKDKDKDKDKVQKRPNMCHIFEKQRV